MKNAGAVLFFAAGALAGPIDVSAQDAATTTSTLAAVNITASLATPGIVIPETTTTRLGNNQNQNQDATTTTIDFGVPATVGITIEETSTQRLNQNQNQGNEAQTTTSDLATPGAATGVLTTTTNTPSVPPARLIPSTSTLETPADALSITSPAAARIQPQTTLGTTPTGSTSTPAAEIASDAPETRRKSAAGNGVTTTQEQSADTTQPAGSSTTTPAISTPSVTSNSNPTTLPGRWSLLGCLDAGSTFNQALSSAAMTPELCTELCQGHKYSATYSSNCYCADTLGGSSSPDATSTTPLILDDERCDIPCPGNPLKRCGGLVNPDSNPSSLVPRTPHVRRAVPPGVLLSVYIFTPATPAYTTTTPAGADQAATTTTAKCTTTAAKCTYCNPLKSKSTACPEPTRTSDPCNCRYRKNKTWEWCPPCASDFSSIPTGVPVKEKHWESKYGKGYEKEYEFVYPSDEEKSADEKARSYWRFNTKDKDEPKVHKDGSKSWSKIYGKGYEKSYEFHYPPGSEADQLKDLSRKEHDFGSSFDTDFAEDFGGDFDCGFDKPCIKKDIKKDCGFDRPCKFDEAFPDFPGGDWVQALPAPAQ